MAQKSKAASLTPDLLTSRTAPTQPAPRKQATDLSLAPVPAASQAEPAKSAAPPAPAPAPKPTPPPSKAKAKAKNVDPAPVPRKMPEEPPAAKAPTAAQPAPQPSSPPAVDTPATAGPAAAEAAVVQPEAAKASAGDGQAVVANERPSDDAYSDYRIRIPVPLDPSEHLELTLAAARSGRSCQEIIVEALFRYLEDIAGPSTGSGAPGPDGQR